MPTTNGKPPGPYRLPGPLNKRGELPVAPGAPRIPRALRAFNGMEAEPAAPLPAPAPQEDQAAAARAANARGGRPREPLTIRDLLEDPSPEPEEEGPLAGLRTALRRLRRSGG